jgi:hypothetical protein
MQLNPVDASIDELNLLSDLINLDIVLKILSYHEIAILYFRLGLLNIFNPIKAEGSYCLDLSRREDRQVARILILMQYVEKGYYKVNFVFIIFLICR